MIWLSIALYVLGAISEYRTQRGPYGADGNNFECILLSLIWPGLAVLCVVTHIFFWLFERN